MGAESVRDTGEGPRNPAAARARNRSTTPRVDIDELLRQTDRFVAENEIARLLEDDRYGIDPKQKEQFWVDIYPRLEPTPCEPHQMLDDWLSRERRRIVFLYMHIPFCVKKCDFCYFHITTDLKLMDDYVDHLEQEMRAYLSHVPSDTQVGDLYFGGGTASLLTAKHLRRLYEGIYGYIDRENFNRVTLELHPRTMREGLQELALSGEISRVSMGVQTFNKRITEANNRLWVSPERIEEICTTYREVGVQNINIDFMSGLYTQTVADAAEDIQIINGLVQDGLVNSISVYPRSFTNSSTFFDKEVIDAPAMLEKFRIHQLYRSFFSEYLDWVESPLYLFLPKSLQAPKPSACVWDDDTVQAVGFGNSARSYFDHTNFLNTPRYEDYLQVVSRGRAATGNFHRLTDPEIKRRHLMFGAKRGYVDMNFPVPLTEGEQEEFERITLEMERDKLVERHEDKVELTPLGVLLIEYIYKQYDKMCRLN